MNPIDAAFGQCLLSLGLFLLCWAAMFKIGDPDLGPMTYYWRHRLRRHTVCIERESCDHREGRIRAVHCRTCTCGRFWS